MNKDHAKNNSAHHETKASVQTEGAIVSVNDALKVKGNAHKSDLVHFGRLNTSVHKGKVNSLQYLKEEEMHLYLQGKCRSQAHEPDLKRKAHLNIQNKSLISTEKCIEKFFALMQNGYRVSLKSKWQLI